MLIFFTLLLTISSPITEGAKKAINIGLPVPAADPSNMICSNLFSVSEWQVPSNYNVAIDMFAIPDMSSIASYRPAISQMRAKNLSGIIYSLDFSVALLTYLTDIPYILISYSHVKVPPHAVAVTSNFDQLGQTVHDLINAVSSYDSITFIVNGAKHVHDFSIFSFFPNEKIELFRLNFTDTESNLRRKMRYLSFIRTGKSTDVYVIVPALDEIKYVDRILTQGFHNGLASANQLWIVSSFFVPIKLLEPFRYAYIRLVTLGVPNTKITSIEKLKSTNCLAAANYIAQMAVKGQKITTSKEVAGLKTTLIYLSLKPNGSSGVWEQVGSWIRYPNGSTQVNLTRRISLKRPSIRIGVYKHQPYFFNLRDNSLGGYIYDIMNSIVKNMGVDIQWVLIKDARIGSLSGPPNSSNGLIGEILSGNVDLGGMPILIDDELKSVLGVSMPLHIDGISLMSYATSKPIDWLTLIRPFNMTVWSTWGLVFLLLILSFFAQETISPNKTRRGKGRYTFPDIIFLTFTSLIITKLKIIPKMFSTRIFVLVLWFASLIMVASYTANLVPFFVRREKSKVLNNFETLYDARKTHTWFWTKDNYVYKAMRDKIGSTAHTLTTEAQTKWPNDMFVTNMTAAIERLKSDPNEVFIVNHMVGYFQSTTDCQLEVGSQILMTSGMGLAFKKDWPLKAQLQKSLEKLSENKDLQRIYQRWLTGPKCPTELTLYWQDLFLVFVILMIGIVLGIIVAIIEFMAQFLRPALLGCCAQKIRFGMTYKAEIKNVEKNGVYVYIGESYYRIKVFIQSSKLNMNPADEIKILDSTKMNIRAKDWIELKCVGTDPITNEPYFIRTA